MAIVLAAITAGYYTFARHYPQRLLRETADYVSFMALVGSLFVIAAGIHIEVRGETKPVRNCLFLAVGGILGNLLGTTGASRLLIRPWIRQNKFRYTGLHTAFFIFLVSNIGGGLLPMGPPLFLGYLKGIPFSWVLANCWRLWAMSMLVLLLIFYFLDRYNYRRAPREIRHEVTVTTGTSIEGLRNLVFLAVVLAAIFIQRPLFLREALMIAAAIASYLATPKKLHEANSFSFAPLKEVGWLFFGIFFTMVPVLDFMRFRAATFPIDSPAEFYWFSGALSSVLDNAPTYLAFLANALGRHQLSVESAAHVRAFLDSGARELVAISLGSVFFGAGTYVGNSPISW